MIVRCEAMIRRWASGLLKLGLTVGALWYLQHKVDLRAAWDVGHRIDPGAFLAAFVLQIVQVLICAWRWRLVLKAIGAWLSFGKACELFCIGNFFGQVLPGAVGGDAVRMWSTRRAGLGLSQSINSVMLERVATVFGLVLLVTITQPYLLDRLPRGSGLWLFPGLTVASAAGILVLTQLDRLPLWLEEWRIVRGFVKLAGDTRRLFLAPRHAVPTLLVVILGHINLALVVWVLGRGLGAHASAVDYLVLVPPVILIATLPISIAGWGARELAMVTALGFVGVPAAQATAMSVLFGVVTILIALPGGFFWLFAKQRASVAKTKIEA
jgi:glycosyltransferase 2 family protein